MNTGLSELERAARISQAVTDIKQALAGAGLVVAIDGPSGSGKSSVAKKVAAELGLGYFDTGAIYRAATWWMVENGIDLADQDLVAQRLTEWPLRQELDPLEPWIWVNGVDVSDAIRQSVISEQVSKIATNLGARAKLVDLQQRVVRAQLEPAGWARGRGVVAEGRDITTVVAPDAQARILLTASEAARLARRALEVHGTADAAALAATTAQVSGRDAQDSKVAQFMTAPDGVTAIDSSDLDFDQTVVAVLEEISRQVISTSQRLAE